MGQTVEAWFLLEQVRRKQPVVHHLTNWVTACDCANVVKTLGASPVMAHAPEEVEEMAAIADALVLNIGTLTVDLVSAMKLAAKSANTKGIPVILDACGAGATRLRDRACLQLIAEVRIDVIKGNASEVSRLSGENVATRGVDSSDVPHDLAEVAQRLSAQNDCTVVITGKDDIVAGKSGLYRVANGHPLMGRVVGTGCMAASVIGAFCAVTSDHALGAAAGLACFGIAGEIAAGSSPAPGTGSFKERMLDALYGLDEKTVRSKQRIFR